MTLLNSRSSDRPDKAPVYVVLAQHQRDEDWDFRDQASALLSWMKRFVQEFKLPITEVALRFDDLPIHIHSHFREGFNGFGLRGEITINVRHFGKRHLGLILGDLLHELIHAWQHEHGRPATKGRHNRQFRSKAAEVGLTVTEDGKTTFSPDGAFQQLLGSCGFALPDHPASVGILPRRPVGKSPLKKWICECSRPVNIRVAVADFQALCLRCNARFRLDAMTAGEADVA